MHWLYIVMPLSGIIFLVLAVALYRVERFNKPSQSIEDAGDSVIVRSSPFCRATDLLAKRVEKARIVKVQRSKNCLTLFTASDSAYDIWLSEKRIAAHLQHARQLFPQAQFKTVK